MSDSLRDQLIKAGLKPAAKPKSGKKKQRRRGGAKPGKGNGASDQSISLARAYALREKEEKRREAERKRAKQREDELRRRQNEQLDAFLKDKALNDPDAEIPRHFQDGDRITRIYVTEAQRDALAKRRLGIIKLRRRYLLVDTDTLAEARHIKPDCVVDLGNEADAD